MPLALLLTAFSRPLCRACSRVHTRWRRLKDDVGEWMARPLVWSVPEVRQLDHVECGVACLLMVLRYHGCWRTMAECREECEAGRDGVNAMRLADVARRFGFHVQSWVAAGLADLRHCPLPLIVHWRHAHYVVITRITGHRVAIIDPAAGRRWLTHDEFHAAFTGLALTLEPGPTFERVPRRPRAQVWRRWLDADLSFLRIAGVGMLLLMCGLVLQALALVFPLLLLISIDRVLPDRLWHLLSWLAPGMFFVAVAHASVRYARTSLLVNVLARLEWWLTTTLVDTVVKLPVRHLQQSSAADLLHRLAGAGIMRDFLTVQSAGTLLDSGSVLLTLGLLGWSSWRLAALAIGVAGAQALVAFAGRTALRICVERHMAARIAAGARLTELLGGIAGLKAAGAERVSADAWALLFRMQVNRAALLQKVVAAYEDGLAGLRVMSLGLFLALGLHEVMADRLTLGTMLALAFLVFTFLRSVESLIAVLQQWPLARLQFERVSDLLQARPDAAGVKSLPELPVRPDIALDRVRFRYDHSSPWAVADLSVTLRAGTVETGDGVIVAMVGRSGAGKSTVAKLIAGIHRPEAGQITLAGVPLALVDRRELYRHCGIVLQDGVLFNTTVAANVALGRSGVTEDDVIAASRVVDLHPDVMDMPLGYDTCVFEAGAGLSGGQRQRILLARALVTRPTVLVLDEAMSHLDVAGERRILTRIRARTSLTVVIAHRLAALRMADLILVLQDGRLIERGTHAQLVSAGGHYAELVAEQSLMEEAPPP